MPTPGPHEVLQALGAILMAGDSGRVYTADVVREGDKVIVPEGAHLPDVISALDRKYRYEEQKTAIHSTIAVPPWDGAYALVKAIEANIGVTVQKETRGKAHQIDVEVELGKTIQIPWGKFELPGMEEATIETDTSFDGGRLVFSCHVECKRKYEDRVRRLLEKVREIATTESLHRGKAFTMSFCDDYGERLPLPTPKFFEFSPETPIFSKALQDKIDRNVIVPIMQSQNCRDLNESLKRGVLFAGRYGVGKTLLASYIAQIAIQHGWTFIYVKDSSELQDALSFAQHYQPVVVFAEDVERVAGTERDDAVNELLNQLDGIDGKSAEIMTILTSNHPDNINEAMRRPGRIDVVLPVDPPDAEAVVRMIKRFAGTLLDPQADLEAASNALEGQIPANVREVVSRAKLEMLRRVGLDKTGKTKMTGPDILSVAQEVAMESELFREKKNLDASNLAAAGAALVAMGHATTGAANRVN